MSAKIVKGSFSVLIIFFLLLNTILFARIVKTAKEVKIQEPSCSIEVAMKEIEPGGTAYCFSGREVFRVYKRKDGSLIVYREEPGKNTLRKEGDRSLKLTVLKKLPNSKKKSEKCLKISWKRLF